MGSARPIHQSVETKSVAVITFTESLYNGTADQTKSNVFRVGRISKAHKSYGDIVSFAQMSCTEKHIYTYALVTNKVIYEQVLKYILVFISSVNSNN